VREKERAKMEGENTTGLRSKDQFVAIVQGDNRCLCLESYETHIVGKIQSVWRISVFVWLMSFIILASACLA
jgi:hypothetical protein